MYKGTNKSTLVTSQFHSILGDLYNFLILKNHLKERKVVFLFSDDLNIGEPLCMNIGNHNF